VPLEEQTRSAPGSIKLASNENPFGPSPRAIAAIAAALSSLHRYPDGSGFYLRQALATRIGVAADAIILGNGSNDIIELAVRAFLRPGDEAVMADQAFVIYQMVVQAEVGRGQVKCAAGPLIDEDREDHHHHRPDHEVRE
jgi:histidinol-phosphate aminotransferase